MITRNNYIDRIRPFIDTDLIKVLTGIRRAGKSVMLSLIQDEIAGRGVPRDHFLSLNFEEMENRALTDPDALHERLKNFIRSVNGKAYIFLDEIQEVAHWETCINSLRASTDCDMYITGSNAHLLSGELATYLAGRYVEFVVYPFSFSEFIRALKSAGKETERRDAFRQYLTFGGMPFLFNILDHPEACLQYLRDIYSSVILKDILLRDKIRDADALSRIIAFLSDNIGRPVSANSIAKYFKSENRRISNDTVMNYIVAAENAFLFHKTAREDLSGKKILAVNEKYYLADHGLRQAIFGNNTSHIDQVLENIVCLELLRRGFTVTCGKNKDKEIDFVAAGGGKKLYLQVTYMLASEETVAREFGAYKGIDDNYPKYVLSLDDIDRSRDGIRHRYLPDFLLDPSWS